VVILAKDLFTRHASCRGAGSEVASVVMEGVRFILKYKRSECADFIVGLDFGKNYFALFGFRVSFCLSCGRFLGFGSRYEVCWICEDEYE
jgi:hypothetical protein